MKKMVSIDNGEYGVIVAVAIDNQLSVGTFTGDHYDLNNLAEPISVKIIRPKKSNRPKPENNFIAYRDGEGKLGGRYPVYFIGEKITDINIAPSFEIAATWAVNKTLGTNYRYSGIRFLNDLII